MASEGSDGNTHSNTSSLSTASSREHEDDMIQSDVHGWLMKRTRISRKWKKKWFLLKSTDLCYGDKPENLGKKIPLAYAEISDTNMDKRQFAFRIKPKHNGRTFYMQAENELKQQDWMQAICFAKAAGRHGDASQACVIQ